MLEEQISKAEDRLRIAMLNSDVEDLRHLLAPELIFTNHLGQLQGRDSELSAYKSGMLKIDHLTPSEQHIMVLHDVAIVSVRVELKGTYGGKPADGTFRFTRVWSLAPDKSWHVVAAHSGIVV